MIVPLMRVAGVAIGLGVGRISTDAFLQAPIAAAATRAGAGITSAERTSQYKTDLEARRRTQSAAGGEADRLSYNNAGLRPSARGRRAAEGEPSAGGRSEMGRPERRASGGGTGGTSGTGGGEMRPARGLLSAVAQQLRQAAATATLAAGLLVASTSTEQDIYAAMKGLDPSLAAANNWGLQQQQQQQQEQSISGGNRGATLGSIDLTGQGSGAGEIQGEGGGGFKEGRLMIDVNSDLAMMLGKKMKNPDAEPRTH